MPKFSSLFNRNSSGDTKLDCTGQATIKPKKKRPENVGSKLLSQAENQHLFLLLGPKRVSLKASVVQLLKENNGKWQHFKVGVVTIVKDYMRKLYSLMLFDIHNGNRLWEQVLNKDLDFQLRLGKQRVLSFESAGTIYGLKFPDLQEELEFKTVLDERMKVEKERKHSNRQRLSLHSSFATFQSDFTLVRSTEPKKTNESRSGFLRFIPFLSSKKKQQPGKEDTKRGGGYGFKSTLSAIQEDKPQVKSLSDERVNKVLELAGLNSDGLTFDDLSFVRQFIDDYQAQMLSNSQISGSQQQAPLTSKALQTIKSDDVFKDESKFFNDSAFDRMQSTKIVEEDDVDITIKATPIKKLPDQNKLKYQSISSLSSFSFNQNKPFEKPELKQAALTNNAKSIPKAPPLPMSKTVPKTTSTPIKSKPVASDPRSNLLNEIQAGIKLRSVGKSVEKSGFSIGQANEKSMEAKTQQATPNASLNSRPTDLLSEIKAGIKLRSVEKSSKKSEESQSNGKPEQSNVSSAIRESQASNRHPVDFLSEIRAGVKLRPVEKPVEKLGFRNSPMKRSDSQESYELRTPKRTISNSSKKSNTSIFDMDNMAGALARALVERRKEVCEAEQYYSTDESSDSEWNDD